MKPKVKKKTAPPGFSEEQQRAFLSMNAYLNGRSDFGSLRAAAVVGPRGIGKSTVLHELKMANESRTGLFCTNVLDAATVRPDMGLLATSLQEIWETAREHLDHHSEAYGSGHQRKKLIDESEGFFRTCLEAALMEEESHRHLAQELAMTPGHYAKIVEEGASRRRKSGKSFQELIDQLVKLLGYDPADRKPKFVVFWDDVDLAFPETVHNWARALLTHYRHPQVCWMVAFDRPYLIQTLSHAEPGRHMRSGHTLDLTSGRALLQKIVSSERQFELARWDFSRRVDFRPIGKKAETAAVFLRKKGWMHLQPLLPGHPRSLEGVYSWIERQPNQRKSERLEEEEAILREAFLRHVAVVEGEEELLRDLDRRGAAMVANALRWEEDFVLRDAAWQELAQSASSSEPLWSLPLPEAFEKKVTGSLYPEAVLEILLDIALTRRTLRPLQLLMRMPFTKSRLEGTGCRVAVLERQLFSQWREIHSSRAGFMWQTWSSAADEQHEWTVEIGPVPLWEGLLGFRSVSPTKMLRTLSLRRQDYLAERASSPPSTELLPARLRSLLLLVDGLLRVPWEKLSTISRLWGVLSYTRCAAVLTLGGYAHHLDPDIREHLHESLGDPETWLDGLDDEDRSVTESYGRVLDRLEDLHDGGAGNDSQSFLLQSFRSLIRMPAVQALR